MSLDVDGFDEVVQGGDVVVMIAPDNRLVNLAQSLPWSDMLDLVLPDLTRTEKKKWWVGRPLRIRIHLGVFILQQMFDLTDRDAENHLRDNAAFQAFCGVGIVEKWHVPDHTKIEAFRSRISNETKQSLANLITTNAVKLKYANPKHLDIDATVQEANITYPAMVNLLLKVAFLSLELAKIINTLCHNGERILSIPIVAIKQLVLFYFRLKRNKAETDILSKVKQRLWCDVHQAMIPVLNQLGKLEKKIGQRKHSRIRKKMETLRWRAQMFMGQAFECIFEGQRQTGVMSLHAYQVGYFNKGKLSGQIQFGRSYQLGRIEGNFLYVAKCDSVYMPDASSLPKMVKLHKRLFGENTINSIATDKGYYSRENERLLEKEGVDEIYLPRPDRVLDARPPKTTGQAREKLHNRRAGIEPLIGHVKQGGQMRKSRMKSDFATEGAGYLSVFGFNLRQLMRCVTGQVRPMGNIVNIKSTKEYCSAVD